MLYYLLVKIVKTIFNKNYCNYYNFFDNVLVNSIKNNISDINYIVTLLLKDYNFNFNYSYALKIKQLYENLDKCIKF